MLTGSWFANSTLSNFSTTLNRAILKTKEELNKGIKSPVELLKHFRFAGKQQPIELSRAREIYEESLKLIEKHVELGTTFKWIMSELQFRDQSIVVM